MPSRKSIEHDGRPHRVALVAHEFLLSASALLLLLNSSSLLFAQQLTPIPIESILNLQKFGEYQQLQFSPDGRFVSFALRDLRQPVPNAAKVLETGIPWYAAGSNLWIVNTETGATRELTSHIGDNWSALRSPDGKYLAFYSDRGPRKRAQIWLKEIVTGRERRLTDLEVKAGNIQWLPDSRQILVIVYPGELTAHELARRVYPERGSTRSCVAIERVS